MATSKLLLSLVVLATTASAQYVLTPPYFNIAENRPITANATCGEGGVGKESYCKLVGGFDRIDETWGMSKDIIDGQVIYVNIAFARGSAHLPIAHALHLLSTQELRFGLTKLNSKRKSSS